MTCSLLPPTTGTLQGNSAYQHNSYKSRAKPKHLDRMCSDCQLWQPCCPVVQLPAAATFAVCLQHAKPQSQNVQHFLVPFAVLLFSRILLPFFRREQTNNCKIDMTDLSLINPTHSHTFSLSLTLSVPLQIWPLGNAPRRCHYNCSHLAAGRLRLVCAHLAGHSST